MAYDEEQAFSLKELAENAAKSERNEFDRDWLILWAYTMDVRIVDIASAVKLSRQHVRRILDQMQDIADSMIDEENPTLQDVITFAFNSDGWAPIEMPTDESEN